MKKKIIVDDENDLNNSRLCNVGEDATTDEVESTGTAAMKQRVKKKEYGHIGLDHRGPGHEIEQHFSLAEAVPMASSSNHRKIEIVATGNTGTTGTATSTGGSNETVVAPPDGVRTNFTRGGAATPVVVVGRHEKIQQKKIDCFFRF